MRRRPRRSCGCTPPRAAALRRSPSTSAALPRSADLGLKTSPALEEVRASAEGAGRSPGRAFAAPAGLVALRRAGERRLVSVVFVELSPAGLGAQADPEDLRELVGAGLAQAISEAEAFGGTVVSVSGFGMSVLFGAPQSHEDDPERALRSALRISCRRLPLSPINGTAVPAQRLVGTSGVALSVRIGVETGPAVVGPVGGGDQVGYGAVGEVVGAAAALQSVARPGSVLVGPATRAATEGIFEWGPSAGRARQRRAPSRSRRPTSWGRGRARSPRPAGAAWRPRPRSSAGTPSWPCSQRPCGRRSRVTAERSSSSVSRGSARRRLVTECRKYFMGWVGAASGRLPLWLEGRCASYASSTPYGAYQQLLCRFIGAPLEAGEAVLRPALEAAVRAVLGKDSEAGPRAGAHDGAAGRAGRGAPRRGWARPSCSRRRSRRCVRCSRAWSSAARPCSPSRTCTGPTRPRSA